MNPEQNLPTETQSQGIENKSHGRFKFSWRVLGILLIPLVIAGAGAVYWFRDDIFKNKVDREISTTNQLVQENDMSQALVHARKALAAAPDDPGAIMAVASLAAKENPDEAKQLYARLLEIQRREDNPDEDGKPATTYWAAAGLAESAGLNDEAKKYYQKTIDAADPSNEYEMSLAQQSKSILER